MGLMSVQMDRVCMRVGAGTTCSTLGDNNSVRRACRDIAQQDHLSRLEYSKGPFKDEHFETLQVIISIFQLGTLK